MITLMNEKWATFQWATKKWQREQRKQSDGIDSFSTIKNSILQGNIIKFHYLFLLKANVGFSLSKDSYSLLCNVRISEFCLILNDNENVSWITTTVPQFTTGVLE